MNGFDSRDVVVAELAAILLTGRALHAASMEEAIECALFLLASAAEKREAIENAVDATPEA